MLPLYQRLVEVLPSLSPRMDNLKRNKARYTAIAEGTEVRVPAPWMQRDVILVARTMKGCWTGLSQLRQANCVPTWDPKIPFAAYIPGHHYCS